MKVLITAGPTREMLDPIRYLSNLSTGEMGYAIAETAHRKKHKVTLISGPTALCPPEGVKFISVISTRDMKRACQKYFPENDVLIMSAAVCDFTISQPSKNKIRRRGSQKLVLEKTPDIVSALARKKGSRVVIGFSLETKDWIRRARVKLHRKHLDGIVANYCGRMHSPFGRRFVRVALINRHGTVSRLPLQSKDRIASKIVRWAEAMSV